MPYGAQRIDPKSCKKVEPPHPCDPHHCDPLEEPKDDCISPFLCIEKIKNPALPDEITRCSPGASINANVCTKQEPPHPCDPVPPCSMSKKKVQCKEPTLCSERINNPETKPPFPPGCDPNK